MLVLDRKDPNRIIPFRNLAVLFAYVTLRAICPIHSHFLAHTGTIQLSNHLPGQLQGCNCTPSMFRQTKRVLLYDGNHTDIRKTFSCAFAQRILHVRFNKTARIHKDGNKSSASRQAPNMLITSAQSCNAPQL